MPDIDTAERDRFNAIPSFWRDVDCRRMVHSFEGVEFYRSEFNPSDGTIVRALPQVQVHGDRYGYYSRYDGVLHQLFTHAFGRDRWQRYGADREGCLHHQWEQLYHWRDQPFAPVPETVDVQLTNWCDYGCPYCYQSSTKRDVHADPQLVTDIITGFDQPPYQIAYGGGEPTAHPEFIDILRKTAELGSVPNYTTAGHMLNDNILQATQQYCGGVALTYHHWKGRVPFKAALEKLRWLRCQVNIHVIADNNVIEALDNVVAVMNEVYGEGWGQVRDGGIVLLAYYPQGRGTLNNLMDKETYMKLLPAKITELAQQYIQLAYSEGLLPYFLSRTHLPVNTSMAERGEGLFSCYVDRKGLMYHSSFHTQFGGSSIYKMSPQKVWNSHIGPNRQGDGAQCSSCSMASRCAIPNRHHYFICAYAEHNR
jgi:sulfatase maturation enzyme AslB (radical SAM superfamily)